MELTRPLKSYRTFQELFTEILQVNYNYWSIRQSISLIHHRIQKKLGPLILTKVNIYRKTIIVSNKTFSGL